MKKGVDVLGASVLEINLIIRYIKKIEAIDNHLWVTNIRCI
jgi:hypothetical protein